MGDKNPKHPLKKKKLNAKANITDHDSSVTEEPHHKKKHVYE